MTTIPVYLKKLLHQYDCVVVPELGGFLARYQPARFEPKPVDTASAGLGRFMPSRKGLAFNEALKLDDGILTNYVMLHESLSREATQQRIGQFVAEVRARSQRTGSYVIDGVGMLLMNAEGRFEFEPELRQNFLGDAYGLPVLEVQVHTANQPLQAITTAVASTKTGEFAGSRIEEPEVEEILAFDSDAVQPMPGRYGWRWAAAAAVVGSLGLLGYLSGAGSSRFQQGSLNPAGLLEIPAYLNRSIQEVLTEKNQQKTETVRPGTAVAIASVSTGPADLPKPVGVSGAVPAGAATVPPKPVVRSVAMLPVAPVMIAMKPVSRSVAPKLMSRPAAHRRSLPVVRTEESVQFSIIAGSFANRNNAVQLCRTLREAGYPDARIIQPTRRATLYKVAAFTTDNQLNLAEPAEKISILTGTPSWIFTDRR